MENPLRVRKNMSVYCVGIGGIGLSGLAQILRGRGCVVRGSDCAPSIVTTMLEERGISVSLKQDGTSFPKRCDLLLYSDAVSPDHPERQCAVKRGIPQMSYFEAVGALLPDYKITIAISGTHGKTTTTAMIANILDRAGFDPTVIVGSIVPAFRSNARVGKSRDVFVIEACEHQAHMLHLHPTMIVLTNIEEDHLDYYRDLDHIVATFQKYINHLPSSGMLIKNNDDKESGELGTDAQIMTYAISRAADVRARGIHRLGMSQQFHCGDTVFTLHVPGKFNVSNALAAIAVGRALGVSEKIMQETLDDFRGVWRRFEVLGEYRNATVISDYAHHPTAIMETIAAAHQFFPKRRLIVIFQPHQRSRTKKLFTKFSRAFEHADFLILQEIYDVAGREQNDDKNVSSQTLAKAIERQGKYALFSENAHTTRRFLDEMIEPHDVILIMGAGDIYHLAEQLKVSS